MQKKKFQIGCLSFSLFDDSCSINRICLSWFGVDSRADNDPQKSRDFSWKKTWSWIQTKPIVSKIWSIHPRQLKDILLFGYPSQIIQSFLAINFFSKDMKLIKSISIYEPLIALLRIAVDVDSMDDNLIGFTVSSIEDCCAMVTRIAPASFVQTLKIKGRRMY